MGAHSGHTDSLLSAHRCMHCELVQAGPTCAGVLVRIRLARWPMLAHAGWQGACLHGELARCVLVC